MQTVEKYWLREISVVEYAAVKMEKENVDIGEESWAVMNTSELLSIIQEYPAIYNKSSQCFRNQRLILNAWNQVADRMKSSVAMCQKCYRSFRTRIGRYVRARAGPSGSGLKDIICEDSEYEQYRWLFTHIKQRGVVTSAQSESSAPSPILSPDPSSASSPVPSSAPSPGPSSAPSPAPSPVSPSAPSTVPSSGPVAKPKYTSSRKRPWSKASKLESEADEIDKQILKALEKPEEEDEDKLFAMSIVPKLRRLKGRVKSRAQLDILRILDDAEFAEPAYQQQEQQQWSGETSQFMQML
ncbi:inactive protein tyrosine kinase pTKL-like [Watersipora subatra]|uniref:inactive protein tyrosine kinase pTKL-like n=1 Tax=Watersipora subatra TaxID=2589382 RepID=UPI00355B6E76